jgi:hypothetical protein
VTHFFGADNLKDTTLDNYQVCDFDALKGVTLSMLKAPRPHEPRYPAMLADLEALFVQH